MTCKVSITKKHGYLHARVTGQNSLDNVRQYLQEVIQACTDSQSCRVLIEEQLDGPRLNTFDVFKVASQSGDAAGTLKAVAYVDVNAQGDLMKFMETVAVNRGMLVKVFPVVDEAERWLMEQSPRTDGN